MKQEKEVLWIVNLLKSKKFTKKLLGKTIGGCIKDFERFAGASENNTEFRKWFYLMVEEGIFEFFEKSVKRHIPVDTYIINIKKFRTRLFKLIQFGKDFYDLAINYYLSFH